VTGPRPARFRLGKRLGLVGLALVLGYLLLWPVSIDPVGWEPPPIPAWTGALAPNEALKGAERIAVGEVHGPEDIAVAADGRMFVGTHDGKIAVVSPDGSEATTLVETGGRPLGLAWDAGGNLLVADAMAGLLSVSPAGEITTLSTASDGVPYRFTDDVDVASDGRIYFSDASDTYGYGHHLEDTLEGRPHGRLLRYDPRTGATETLLDGLYFANGVAVAADDTFVLVAETSRFRIRRYWLTGERAGTHDVFAEGLPGYPDGVSRSPRGTFWVAFFTVRNPTADRLAPSPFLTKVVWRLPAFLLPTPQKVGLVLELDDEGNVLRSLHDTTGEHMATITSVEEVDGTLHLGTLHAAQIGRLRLPPSPELPAEPEPVEAPSSAAAKLRVDPPKLQILGIAQDAGVPQAACTSPGCEAARRDPALRQRAASIALALPDGAVWIVDATPDFREQLDDAIALQQQLGARVDPRRPLAGILLTHAHMGHYLGLAHLGFEAAHTRDVPVLATARMVELLRTNAPWDQLVRLRNIEPRTVEPGRAIDLSPVRVIPIAVPHRAEYTDTVAYRFEGPGKVALYLPDCDPWSAHADAAALFHGVDVALVDATFFSGDELPGRDLSTIGHPTVRSTIELLGARVKEGTLQVVLIHLNHSNPLLDPRSAARTEVEAAGFTLAHEGLAIAL
jgi:coenzyme PQQ biosynthesis protein B